LARADVWRMETLIPPAWATWILYVHPFAGTGSLTREVRCSFDVSSVCSARREATCDRVGSFLV